MTSLRLAGWKSIRDATLELRPLNVIIGANGAGKSNLVSFFKLMNEMRGGRLQIHVGTTGGAESLLHYGSKRTQVIEAEFRFVTDLGKSDYSLRLAPTANNSLFAEEKLEFYGEGDPPPSIDKSIRGQSESHWNAPQKVVQVL